jgi:hypothetical protein
MHSFLPPRFTLFEAMPDIVGGEPYERWLGGFFGLMTEPAESVSLGLRGEDESVLVSTAMTATYTKTGGLWEWAVHLGTQAVGLDSPATTAAMQQAPDDARSEHCIWSRVFEWGGVQVGQLPDGRAVSVTSRSGRLYGLPDLREVQEWGGYGIDGSVTHHVSEIRANRQEHGPQNSGLQMLGDS